MKYTKGEWKVVKQSDSEHDIVSETDDGFEFLGDVMNKEDAVLMSAAPDMHKALKMLDACITDCAKSKYWCFEIAQKLIPVRDAAYAALLKAEGKGEV